MRPHDLGVYDGDLAHARARERARRPRRGQLLADAGLRAEVQAKLELEWSPEQIAAWLRRAYPDRPVVRVIGRCRRLQVQRPDPARLGGRSRTHAPPGQLVVGPVPDPTDVSDQARLEPGSGQRAPRAAR